MKQETVKKLNPILDINQAISTKEIHKASASEQVNKGDQGEITMIKLRTSKRKTRS